MKSHINTQYNKTFSFEIKYQNYEAENAWWYYFFQATGFNNYDAEYANSLRIDGIPPEEAAKQVRI